MITDHYDVGSDMNLAGNVYGYNWQMAVRARVLSVHVFASHRARAILAMHQASDLLH